MDSSKVLPKGRVLNGIYTIEKVLGAGGFGITYLARRMTGNITQWLAVKEFFISSICSRSGDDVWVSNVNREQYEIGKAAFISQANRIYLNGIHFPNIVGVNEVFEQNETAYYVMEFVRGCTLAEYVGERGGLSADAAIELLTPVMKAVHLLHSMRILHLDIKPENVIIGRDDITDRLRPVLIDFDLSKHYGPDGEVTSALQFISCSEGYAPKEQYELEGLGRFLPQADVYGLGATLLFMLTGKSPVISSAFDRESLSRLLPDGTPENVARAIYEAMAPDAADRTPSVAQMACALGIDPSDWPVASGAADCGGRPEVPKKKWSMSTFSIIACISVLSFAIVFWLNYAPGSNDGIAVAVPGGEISMRPVTVDGVTVYMAETEVTQGLWNAVMRHGSKQFQYPGVDNPAMGLAPADCERFIKALNDSTGMRFRLPTPDEWMHACAPETGGRNAHADGQECAPHKVGASGRNSLGLYDMQGNVSEMTKDELAIAKALGRSGQIYFVCGQNFLTEGDTVPRKYDYSIIKRDRKFQTFRKCVGLRDRKSVV